MQGVLLDAFWLAPFSALNGTQIHSLTGIALS